MDRRLQTQALRVNWLNLALGHTSLRIDDATFVRNPAYPSIYDANFIYDARASTDEETDRLVTRAREEYAHCGTLTFRLGPEASPALASRLALVGTERNGSLVMLLEGELRGPAVRTHDLRPIEDDAGWAALTEMKRADWREHAPKIGEDPLRMEIPDGLSATSRMKCPPVRYFLAYADGRPVGFFNAWEGVDGVGQVEDLYVLPEHRRRGVATALIHHCVADARAHGAGPVVICSDPADTPKTMYAAMGWRPIAVCRQYGVKVR